MFGNGLKRGITFGRNTNKENVVSVTAFNATGNLTKTLERQI